MRFDSDRGNIGVELLAVGIIGPLLITFACLQLQGVERQKLASQQLARQLVRIGARDADLSVESDLAVKLTAQNLGMGQDRIIYRVWTDSGLARAKVTIDGNTETAVMRVQK